MSQKVLYFALGAAVVLAANYFFNFPSKKS